METKTNIEKMLQSLESAMRADGTSEEVIAEAIRSVRHGLKVSDFIETRGLLVDFDASAGIESAKITVDCSAADVDSFPEIMNRLGFRCDESTRIFTRHIRGMTTIADQLTWAREEIAKALGFED